jgi:hypothetical protein
MSFKNTDQKTEVKFFEDKDNPKIIFTSKILAIMKYIVDNNSDEVGWLGSVEVIDGSYWITDIYLPKQEVNGGTCELAPDGMQELCNHMISNGQEDKIDKVHFWGHSHVNMGTSPSGQDLQQSMEKLRDFGGSFFIRAICNKAGQMSVAFYDGANKRIIENIVWYVHDGVNRKEIEDTFGPMIKENVKKLTYTPPAGTVTYPNHGSYSDFESRWDGYQQNKFGKSGGSGKGLIDEFSRTGGKHNGVRRRLDVTLKSGGGK